MPEAKVDTTMINISRFSSMTLNYLDFFFISYIFTSIRCCKKNVHACVSSGDSVGGVADRQTFCVCCWWTRNWKKSGNKLC